MNPTGRWSRGWHVLLTVAFLVGPALGEPILAESGPPTNAPLVEPRVGHYAGYSRVVLDLPEAATYTLEPLGVALRISLPGLSVTPGTKKIMQAELSGYALENGALASTLTLVTPQGVSSRSGFRATRLEAAAGKTGSRLVIDLSGAFADASPLPAVPAYAFLKAAGLGLSAVIDPGHGGSDPGARGVLTEAPLNLEVAHRVVAFLQAAGVDVLLTRNNPAALTSDKTMDLASRAAMAKGRSVFVSIHANARPARLANDHFGAEVYYFSPSRMEALFPAAMLPEPLGLDAQQRFESLNANNQNQPTSSGPRLKAEPSQVATPDLTGPDPRSLGLQPIIARAPTPEQDTNPNTALEPATEINLAPSKLASSPIRAEASQRLALSVLSHLIGTTAAFNGGAHNADYYVIRESECPAILVEMGYVTHPVEGEALRNPNYLDRIAYGVAYGVLEYLEHGSSEVSARHQP